MAIEHVGKLQFAPGKGNVGDLKENVRIVDISAGASVGSTYFLLRFPSNTKLMGESTFIANGSSPFDSGAYTLSVGLFGVNGNIPTDDDDALVSHTQPATETSAYFEIPLVSDPANYGKQLWELVSGLTEDPGGDLDMKVTLKTNVSAGGRLNVMIIYQC